MRLEILDMFEEAIYHSWSFEKICMDFIRNLDFVESFFRSVLDDEDSENHV